MAEVGPAGALMEMLALMRASHDRTVARRQLRGASELVAVALIRHLRTGDQARVGDALYQVAAVTWPVRDPNDPTRPRPARPASALLRNDLVLHDVRRKAAEGAPAVGHRFAHVPQAGEPVWDLHLASDADVRVFAAELPQVLTGFHALLQEEAHAFRGAVERLLEGLLAWEGLAAPPPRQPPRQRQRSGIPPE